MDMKEHKKIILEALNDYRRWHDTVHGTDKKEDLAKMDMIDDAIDAMLGVV